MGANGSSRSEYASVGTGGAIMLSSSRILVSDFSGGPHPICYNPSVIRTARREKEER